MRRILVIVGILILLVACSATAQEATSVPASTKDADLRIKELLPVPTPDAQIEGNETAIRALTDRVGVVEDLLQAQDDEFLGFVAALVEFEDESSLYSTLLAERIAELESRLTLIRWTAEEAIAVVKIEVQNPNRADLAFVITGYSTPLFADILMRSAVSDGQWSAVYWPKSSRWQVSVVYSSNRAGDFFVYEQTGLVVASE